MAFIYPINGPFTVTQAMQACGVTTLAKSQTLASELFDDDYADCKDKKMSELIDGFKVLHKTPANQGGVKVSLRVQMRIKAFCQWTKDQLQSFGVVCKVLASRLPHGSQPYNSESKSLQ